MLLKKKVNISYGLKVEKKETTKRELKLELALRGEKGLSFHSPARSWSEKKAKIILGTTAHPGALRGQSRRQTAGCG